MERVIYQWEAWQTPPYTADRQKQDKLKPASPERVRKTEHSLCYAPAKDV